MSKEQQLQAMQDIDAQLAEKVPSWNELQADGKAELAKFFVMGAPEFEAKINKNIEVAKQSLDTQLEELAGFIVSKNTMKLNWKTLIKHLVKKFLHI